MCDSISLCPKGWHLPLAGRNVTNNTSQGIGIGQPYNIDDSIYQLLLAYGYPKTGDYTYDGNDSSYTSIPTTIGNEHQPGYSEQNPALSPLYFTRAGITNPSIGTLRHLGSGSGISAATAYYITAQNYLGYYMTREFIYPTGNTGRFNGWAIRCLAR